MTAGRPLNRPNRPTGIPAGFDEGDDTPPYTVAPAYPLLAKVARAMRTSGAAPIRTPPQPEEGADDDR